MGVTKDTFFCFDNSTFMLSERHHSAYKVARMTFCWFYSCVGLVSLNHSVLLP